MAEVLTKMPSATAWQATSSSNWLVQEARSSATSNDSIDAQWREIRQHHRAEGQRLQNGHRSHYQDQVAKVRDLLRKSSVADLLVELSTHFGVSWSDIARLLSVSVPALRKWRRDQNGASPENHDRLAGLVGFLRQLKSAGVNDPAAWMLMPLDPDHTVTPRDLYSSARWAVLLDHAAGSLTAEELLDETELTWRSKYVREYNVVIAEDGGQSLVRHIRHTESVATAGY